LPPSDEAIDCFSFVAYELVRSTCQNGMAAKAKYDPAGRQKRPASPYVSRAGSVTPQKKLKVDPYADLLDEDDPAAARPLGPFSKDSDAPMTAISAVDGAARQNLPSPRRPINLDQAIEGERLADMTRVKKRGFGAMSRRNYSSLRAKVLAA
jgi:hypothetical protein